MLLALLRAAPYAARVVMMFYAALPPAERDAQRCAKI